MRMRVAVIGANGRTGRILVDRLSQGEDTVFAGVRNPAAWGEVINVTPFHADVASEELISLPSSLDAIIFAASASSGWTLTNQSPKNVDYKGVRRVVNAADDSTHIVLITSKGVVKSGFYAPRFLLNLLWGRVCHWKRQGELSLREHHAGPATIIRPGYLERAQTEFGPDTQLVFGQGDTFGVGAIARENLVDVVLQVLQAKPNVTFEVIRRVPEAGDRISLDDLKPAS